MVTKKKALGIDPLGWIKQTKGLEEKEESKTNNKKTTKLLPKFETYEVKLTTRLNEEQLDFLTTLEREIMKKRSGKNKKERITKNSLIRTAVEVLKIIDFDRSEIADEKKLVERVIGGLK